MKLVPSNELRKILTELAAEMKGQTDTWARGYRRALARVREKLRELERSEQGGIEK